MKDGIIEQLDTPAKIVLNPATEYVENSLKRCQEKKFINRRCNGYIKYREFR